MVQSNKVSNGLTLHGDIALCSLAACGQLREQSESYMNLAAWEQVMDS